MGTSSMDPSLRRLYDGYFDGTSAWYESAAEDKAANIVRLCTALPHDTLLDIGAGEGAILQRLGDAGFAGAMTALEVSSSAVAAIESRTIPRLEAVRLFDGYEIPFADGSFDLVTLSHVVEHLESPRALLREAARVGDHVFVEVPLEDTLRLNCATESIGHINFYSRKTIVSLVRTCGLEVVSTVSTAPMRAYEFRGRGRRAAFKAAVHRLSPRVAEAVFTYHFALVCRSARARGPGHKAMGGPI